MLLFGRVYGNRGNGDDGSYYYYFNYYSIYFNLLLPLFTTQLTLSNYFNNFYLLNNNYFSYIFSLLSLYLLNLFISFIFSSCCLLMSCDIFVNFLFRLLIAVAVVFYFITDDELLLFPWGITCVCYNSNSYLLKNYLS